LKRLSRLDSRFFIFDEKGMKMFKLQEKDFRVLSRESAREWDAKRPMERKRFTTVLPGGNAFLLDDADFDPLRDEIDPGEVESGCLLKFEEALSEENRELLLSGLIERGYAITRYPDHLLVVPWRRGVTDIIEQDVRQILVDHTPPLVQQATVSPLDDGRLFRLANQILEVYHHRNLCDFLGEIWCSDLERINTVALYSIVTMGDEEVGGIGVWDQQGHPLLPDLELPYWKTALEVADDTPAHLLSQDLEVCDSDGARLAVLNAYLRNQRVFQEMGLPEPKDESPFFQRPTKLKSQLMQYPAVYDEQAIQRLTLKREALAGSVLPSLETILKQGIAPFYAWVRKQARKAEPIIFIEGHLAANPVACYISASLRDPVGHVHLYEEMIYTSSGARPIPEKFQQFLWKFHDAFADQHVTARVLADWVTDGMLIPYRDVEDTDRRYQAISQTLGEAIQLVRQGFRDPNQPTDEECLGIAMAYACAWEGPRIARTCLRLCYAALQDANYATMERLFREHFGEETFD
jgi:hypothetical protein